MLKYCYAGYCLSYEAISNFVEKHRNVQDKASWLNAAGWAREANHAFSKLQHDKGFFTEKHKKKNRSPYIIELFYSSYLEEEYILITRFDGLVEVTPEDEAALEKKGCMEDDQARMLKGWMMEYIEELAHAPFVCRVNPVDLVTERSNQLAGVFPQWVNDNVL